MQIPLIIHCIIIYTRSNILGAFNDILSQYRKIKWYDRYRDITIQI